MKIIEVTRSISEGNAILSADFTSIQQTGVSTIFFSYPEEYYDFLPLTADPFFPALLIPSMLNGENLEIEPDLSRKIYENQFTLQDIFFTWNPSTLSKIKVTANNRYEAEKNQYQGNATFFSLGVDSMYSMLKYLKENNPPRGKELTHLIYMKGLELPLSIYSKGQDKEVIKAIKSLASHYNLKVIVGETNIRDVFPISYEKLYFGPSLASAALSLSNGFKNIYIPSSNSYASLFPDPSSPLTDALWSNEGTTLSHDGSEKERVEKVADLIVTDQYALDSLRVCVCNEGGNYNCCKCWKCIRTMITLEIAGKLKSSKAFPHPLPKSYAKELRTFDLDSMEYVKENWKLARKYGNKEIEKILFNEIRIGKIDLFREEKSVIYLLKEILYYLYIKTGRFFKILDY